MLKKSLTLGVMFGVAILLSSTLLSPAADAIGWGAMSASPDITPFYLERYGSDSLTLTVSYSAFFFQYFPVWVEINVVKCPDWLTVTPSQKTFVLSKDVGSKNIKISMALNQQDIQAGDLQIVEFEVIGRIILGGQLREVTTGKAEIQVGVNPYTQITLEIAKPIERTAPDRELTFPITVKNWGNADTTVTLSLTDKPGEWQSIINPAQLILPAKKPGDPNPTEQVASLTLTSPHGWGLSYHNDWQGIALQAAARTQGKYYVLEGDRFKVSSQDKETITIFNSYTTMLAKNKGFYVPGFDSILLIGALVAIALVMKKKKQ